MIVVTGTVIAIAAVFGTLGISVAGLIYWLMKIVGRMFNVGGLVPPPEYFFENKGKK